jgi:hypothetical protein
MSFRVQVSQARTTAGTSFARLDLKYDSMGTRVAEVMPNFEYFRVTRVRAYSVLQEDGTVGAAVHALAFIPAPTAENTIPASFTTMTQWDHFHFGNQLHTCDLKMGFRDLEPQTPEKWYHTYTTGSPLAPTSAGQFVYALSTAFAVSSPGILQYMTVEGEVEFTSPIAPTASAMKLRRQMLDELEETLGEEETPAPVVVRKTAPCTQISVPWPK